MRRTAKSTSTALKHKHIATKWRKWAETGGFGGLWLFLGLFWDSRGVFVFERRTHKIRGAPQLIRGPNIYPNCRCSNRVDEATYIIDVPAFCGFGPFWGSFSVSFRVRVVRLFGLCLGSGRNLFLQICVWTRVASRVALL